MRAGGRHSRFTLFDSTSNDRHNVDLARVAQEQQVDIVEALGMTDEIRRFIEEVAQF